MGSFLNSGWLSREIVSILQRKYHVAPGYLKIQPQINARMRTILIDWLIQVHLRFTLLQETLFLTVSIIDRYLKVHHSVYVLKCLH